MLLSLAVDASVAQSVNVFGCLPKGWMRRSCVQIPVEVKNFYLSARLLSHDMVGPPALRPPYQFDFPNFMLYPTNLTLRLQSVGKKRTF